MEQQPLAFPHGDWSLRLCVSHSPTALLELLQLAQQHVIKWPEGAREVLVKLAGTPTYASCGAKVLVAVGASMCFVCGHDAEESHPHLKAALLCSVCQQRFTDSIWECDSELLGYRCLGCAHEGAAPHGCRSCGSSLCERCVFTLHGPLGLQDARMQRFSMSVTCPVCKHKLTIEARQQAWMCAWCVVHVVRNGIRGATVLLSRRCLARASAGIAPTASLVARQDFPRGQCSAVLCVKSEGGSNRHTFHCAPTSPYPTAGLTTKRPARG